MMQNGESEKDQRDIFGSTRYWHVHRNGEYKLHYLGKPRPDYDLDKPFYSFNTEVDPLEQKDIYVPYRYDSEKQKLLFYLAQNYRGWNILINNEENTEYRVRVTDYELDDAAGTVSKIFSHAGEDYELVYNRARTRSDRRFILVQLKSNNPVKLIIKKRDKESGEYVNVDSVQLGLINGRPADIPLLLNDTLAGEYQYMQISNPALLEAASSNPGILVWYTSMPAAFYEIQGDISLSLSSDEIEDLRNMGYIN
jgi:hypothetical protein